MISRNPFLRAGASLVVIFFLSYGHLGGLWADNRSMIQMGRCLIPIGWISDLDRPWIPAVRHTTPANVCLEGVRQHVGASTRVRARLELIAGSIAANDERWQVAIHHYRNAVAMRDRPVPDIWSAIVGIYMWKLKDHATALQTALQGLSISPEHEHLRVTAALLYLYYVPPYSNFSQALAVIRPQLGFTHPYHYIVAAGIYLALDRLDNGIRMAQESVRLSRAMKDANLAAGLYLLGRMQRCNGQPALGIANLREAQALAPNDEGIREALTEQISKLCGPSNHRN